MTNLQGRVAIISDGASGMGEACATAFCAAVVNIASTAGLDGVPAFGPDVAGQAIFVDGGMLIGSVRQAN